MCFLLTLISSRHQSIITATLKIWNALLSEDRLVCAESGPGLVRYMSKKQKQKPVEQGFSLEGFFGMIDTET